MMRPGRLQLGLRDRLWATVVGAITIIVLGLTWGFNLVVANRLDHEANTVVVARATAELDALRVTPHGVQLAETFDAGAADTPIWVYQGAKVLEQPRRSAPADRAAAQALTRSRGYVDVARTGSRLYSLPILSGGRRAGTVVAAVSLGPYESIKRVALVGSTLLALFVVVAVAAASRWVISRSLRPVAQMTQLAAEWSEHELEHRFEMGEPTDEFTRLARTLDDLLDRVAASLRHEQNLTAELSHELRTPLTQITTEAQYALRHADGDQEAMAGYERILESAQRMARILDTLISAARVKAGPASARSDAEAGARAAIDACEPLATANGVEIELHADRHGISAAVEPGLLERVLSPLLENACRYARHHVRVAVGTDGSTVRFEVTDDGPGVAAEDFEKVFVPSYHGPAGADNRQLVAGTGLGLPLARRLARGAGGNVRPAESASGARFIVNLPRA
jgi:signal transduction histidine kinase